MLEVKKLHEKKEMEEWELLEQSGDDDYQAMLCYYMEKEMKQIFEQFFKEPKPSTTIYDYGRKLMALEMEYEKEGLSWEEISEIRRDIVNGKN
jgi:hypothetical protein